MRLISRPQTLSEKQRTIQLWPIAVITDEQMALLEDSPPSAPPLSQPCYLQRTELAAFTALLQRQQSAVVFISRMGQLSLSKTCCCVEMTINVNCGVGNKGSIFSLYYCVLVRILLKGLKTQRLLMFLVCISWGIPLTPNGHLWKCIYFLWDWNELCILRP